MTLNAIDTQLLKKCWGQGLDHNKAPWTTTGKQATCRIYFVKYSEKTMKTCEGFTGRRYNSSKNLVIPEPQKTVSSRNAFNHIVKFLRAGIWTKTAYGKHGTK